MELRDSVSIYPSKMAENDGDDESDFDSVTSSQKSFLNNCPFAYPESDPRALPLQTKSSGRGAIETDSASTEVLGNPISSPVVRKRILSFSSSRSLDSINDDDVFRTPPENASLSSAADSDPRVRVSGMMPTANGGGSKLKSPSTKSVTTPVSSSPSLPEENVRVLETNRLSDSVKPVTVVMPSPPSAAADNVRIPVLSSPRSIATSDVRVLGKHSDHDSPSAMELGNTSVMENQQNSCSMANTGVPSSPSPTKYMNLDYSSPFEAERIKITETENPGGGKTDIPFKEIIETLLRNSGENLHESETASYIDILQQCGFKFP